MRIKYIGTLVEEVVKKTIAPDIDEKLQVIRALLRKHNLQLYRNDVEEEVCKALEKDTPEGYKEMIARLKGSRLGNILIAHIGHSNAMSLVFKLENALRDAIKISEMNESMTELQASIEVH